MEPALPIDYVEFDSSVELTGDVSQMSAEQYLSWVRDQASKLPDVVTAQRVESLKPVPKTIPHIESISSCPEDYLPSSSWSKDVIYKFSELREVLYRRSLSEQSKERLQTVPAMKDSEGWFIFCLGTGPNDEIITESVAASPTSLINQYIHDKVTDNLSLNDDDELDGKVKKRKREVAKQFGIMLSVEAEEDVEEIDQEDVEDEDNGVQVWTGARNVEPTSKLILQFDQVLTQRLLGYHIDWLEERQLTADSSRWIYSLLARLEKPLHRNTSAIIRQLYRKCCNQRSELLKTDPDFEALLARLNILISISGSYFGQGEELQFLQSSEDVEEVENKDTGDVEEENDDEDDTAGYYYEDEVEEENSIEVELNEAKRLRVDVEKSMEVEEGECT